MNNQTSVIRQRAMDLYDGGAGAGEICFDVDAGERYGVWDVDEPLPILPGIQYRMRSPQVSCLRRSTPGPVFVWEGHLSPFDGLCAHWSIADLRVEFSDSARWDPAARAISIPVAGPVCNYLLTNLSLENAHHGIYDVGSFFGTWRRLFLRRCSRAIEKVGGTTMLLENIGVGGREELWWDNKAFWLEDLVTSTVLNCYVDPFLGVPDVAYGVLHLKNTYGCVVSGFDLERIVVGNGAAAITREGAHAGLVVQGVFAPGGGPQRHNGTPAPLTNW